MKKLLAILLALMLCIPAACAESEAAIDLAGYIGRPFAELMTYLNEPADEVQAFKEGRWQKNNFEDGYTIYLSVGDEPYALTVRASVDSYPDYGWEADTVFYLTTTVKEYSLFGCCIGDYFPDVDARLRADGWTEAAEYMDYCEISYEKIIDDVKYTLGFIYPKPDFYENYNRLTCISLQGVNLAEPEKDGFMGWLGQLFG